MLLFFLLMQLAKIINSAILVPEVYMSVSWLLNLSFCDATWLLSFVSVMLALEFSISVSWLPEVSRYWFLIFIWVWWWLPEMSNSVMLVPEILICLVLAPEFLAAWCWLLNFIWWFWLLNVFSVRGWLLNFYECDVMATKFFISVMLAPGLKGTQAWDNFEFFLT